MASAAPSSRAAPPPRRPRGEDELAATTEGTSNLPRARVLIALIRRSAAICSPVILGIFCVPRTVQS